MHTAQRDTHTIQCSASITFGHVFQGLLKVALENARLQEKQLQQERRELKMELYREREMRESLERQLTSELRSRGKVLSCNSYIGELKNLRSSSSFWWLQVELFTSSFLMQPLFRDVWRRRRRQRGGYRRRWNMSPSGEGKSSRPYSRPPHQTLSHTVRHTHTHSVSFIQADSLSAGFVSCRCLLTQIQSVWTWRRSAVEARRTTACYRVLNGTSYCRTSYFNHILINM